MRKPFLGMAVCPDCRMKRSVALFPDESKRFGRHNTASGFALCRGSGRALDDQPIT